MLLVRLWFVHSIYVQFESTVRTAWKDKKMTTRLTRTWPKLIDAWRRMGGCNSLEKEISDMSKALKKEVCESKKSSNEIILEDMKERLKKQKEAMEESLASLRSESKVAVETKKDAANLCELVKLKPWKVKLLIHDSAPKHVKEGITDTATKAGLKVKVVKDSVMMEH